MEGEYIDKLSLSLDEIIKHRLVAQPDQVPKYRRSRSRSCSRARSMQQRPDSQNSGTSNIKTNQQWRPQGGWNGRERSVSREFERSRSCERSRSRSRSRSQWQSNSGIGGLRSNQQWGSQGGWKDRGRSVSREFGRSRSRSRSRSQWQSDSGIGGLRSNQQWGSQGGWKDRGRSVLREFGRSRSGERSRSHSRNRRSQWQSNNGTSSIRSNNQWSPQGGWKGREPSVSRSERSGSQCSARTGSLYSFRSGTSRRPNSYGNNRYSPWLFSNPRTCCQCGCHQCSRYKQNLSTANTPKYMQGHIWRANANPYYAYRDCAYYKKMAALQQLRIAQQRVRHAKRLLNNKMMRYHRLQRVRQKPLVFSQHMSQNRQPFPIFKRVQRNNYRFYPQQTQKFDLSDYSDGELSVTIDNELARKVADSPINLTKKASYPADQPEEVQGFMSAEENSPELKYNGYESSS